MPPVTDLATSIPAIHPDLSRDDVLPKFDAWKAFVRAVNEADKLVEADAMAWIERNGPMEFPSAFYWLGHDKRTKCLNVHDTVEALLEVTGGDLSAVCRDFLSSNAVKYGAAKRVLPPDVYARLFEERVVDTLEIGERLPKKLQHADPKFMEAKR
jgi:hypothetical protein